MTKRKNDKKKWPFILIIGIILIIAIIILLMTIFKEKRLKPYVIEKEIVVLSPKDEITLSAVPYFKDENGTVIDVEGTTWKTSTITYKFTEYSVSEPDKDGNVTHTIKIEASTPIEYLEENNRKYPYRKYTLLFMQPSLFDYYTGAIFKEKHVSSNNTINYYDVNNVEDEMAYTEVTWDDKTYKIGVSVNSTMKWDGMKKTDNGDGTSTITDQSNSVVYLYVKTPKDYDGLMLFLTKKGTNKEQYLNQLNYNKRYNELVKEASETGEKSEELVEMEEKNNKTFKLLESRTKGEPDYKNDYYYVLRASDIGK